MHQDLVKNLRTEYYFSPGRIERAFGEFDRFEKYAAKKDMINVEIPENVQEAVDLPKNMIANI